MSDNNDFIISTMRWSFSRLNSFYNCPYEWQQDYLECVDKTDSAVAQFGSYIHKILEMYAKGELTIFDLSQYYEEHFNENITMPFPANKYVDMYSKYYQAGIDYLDNIDLQFDRYEILGVEKEVLFKIDKYDFIGYIDLLLYDRKTGEIVIMDHKSASIGILRSGAIAKKDREHFESFKKQLYLYAKPVLEEYGRVDKLKWNLFKDRKFIEIPFDYNEYNSSLQWAVDTIHLIENEREWNISNEMQKSVENHKWPGFYCMNLCSIRYGGCPIKEQLVSELKEWQNEI